MSLLPLYATPVREKSSPEKEQSPYLKSSLFHKRWTDPIELYLGSPLFGNGKIITKRGLSKTKVTKRCDQKQSYYLEGKIPIPITHLTLFGSYFYSNLQSNPLFAEKQKQLKIRYRTQTFCLYRTSFLTPLLGLHTLIGAKRAEIEERQQMESCLIEKEKKSFDFKGAGPMIGLYLNWSFFDRISLVARGAGSCLIKKSSKKMQEKGIDFKRNNPLFASNLFLLVGLQWNFLPRKAAWVVGLDYRKECLRQFKRGAKMNRRVFNGFSSLRFVHRTEDFVVSGVTLRAGIKF